MTVFTMKCSSYIQQTVPNQTVSLMQTYIEKLCQLASLSKFSMDGKLLNRYFKFRKKSLSSIFNVDKLYLSSNETLSKENKTFYNITKFLDFENWEMQSDNIKCSESLSFTLHGVRSNFKTRIGIRSCGSTPAECSRRNHL